MSNNNYPEHEAKLHEARLRRAYEATVARAAKEGKSDFMCGTMLCDECPFRMYIGHCTDESVEGGAGRKRTVKEWREWWHELTGEESAATETVEAVAEHTGEDTLQPAVSAPKVDISWTTATGAVKHRYGPIALLDGEMQQFSRELGVWISQMSKPDTSNSLADSITFVAREACEAHDETGAVLVNVELFAELFGKCKVWDSIVK